MTPAIPSRAAKAAAANAGREVRSMVEKSMGLYTVGPSKALGGRSFKIWLKIDVTLQLTRLPDATARQSRAAGSPRREPRQPTEPVWFPICRKPIPHH